MTKKALVSFLIVFALVALVSGLAARSASWGYEVLGCAQYREPGTFMAYCGSDQYGDYEHGAYYYNLEPDAVQNLRKAKVVFLGDSRTQIGFSTDPVNDYFRQRAIPYYIAGFGYAETVDFEQLLVERYRIKPDVLIINSDPFFKHGSRIATAIIAPPSLETFPAKIWSWLDYKEKRLFNAVRFRICNRLSALCHMRSIAIYRNKQNGSWIWVNLWTNPEQGSIPIDLKKLKPLPLPGADDVASANKLIDASGVRRQCVVLITIPNSEMEENSYAVELAKKLGVHVQLTKADNLVTIDGSHLTWSSAQRWSARFVRDIDPVIKACVPSASQGSGE